jgi:DNA uptake protein ComE-like DNA-binding protein
MAVTLVCLMLWSPAYGADPKPVTPRASEQKIVPVGPPVGQQAPLDINTASREQLLALPGVGAAMVQKIIDGRPYAKKDQLKSRKILPENVYEKVRGRIIAKQSPKRK